MQMSVIIYSFPWASVVHINPLLFQDFANQAENIFRGSERHTDLDKAYQRLVRAIFDNILRISSEHLKTPREVIMMGK